MKHSAQMEAILFANKYGDGCGWTAAVLMPFGHNYNNTDMSDAQLCMLFARGLVPTKLFVASEAQLQVMQNTSKGVQS